MICMAELQEESHILDRKAKVALCSLLQEKREQEGGKGCSGQMTSKLDFLTRAQNSFIEYWNKEPVAISVNYYAK